jgi:hypothetical protein
MDRRRTIRTCLLFGGVTLSLASVPTVLEQVEAARRAATPGAMGPGGIELPEGVRGLDRGGIGALEGERDERLVLMGDLDDEQAQRLLEEAQQRRPRAPKSAGRGPTRVLGPDD